MHSRVVWSLPRGKFSPFNNCEIIESFLQWSSASIVEHEPRCPVEVNGVKFFVPDIEALQMIFFDRFGPDIVHIGNRCPKETNYHIFKNTQNNSIPTDEFGRVANADCRDINPGTFHIILGNYLGIDQYSLVMDEDYTAEIWNCKITFYRLCFSNVFYQIQLRATKQCSTRIFRSKMRESFSIPQSIPSILGQTSF